MALYFLISLASDYGEKKKINLLKDKSMSQRWTQKSISNGTKEKNAIVRVLS